MNAIELLEEYSDVRSQADLLNLDYNLQRNLILATVQAELDALDAEYQPKRLAAAEKLTALEGEIKRVVAAGGATVKGGLFQAVYTKGRVSWDSKALEGYAAAHPEIIAFRKEGEPSVSIRVAGNGKG